MWSRRASESFSSRNALQNSERSNAADDYSQPLSQDTAQRLLTTLRILRNRHRCTLPIEIWGFPDELAGLGAIREAIDSLDGEVHWRTVNIGKREGKWKQFHIVRLTLPPTMRVASSPRVLSGSQKGEVLARSSFSEILYLDSDSVPMTDPTFLFDSPTYRQHGAVLWPDFNRDAGESLSPIMLFD